MKDASIWQYISNHLSSIHSAYTNFIWGMFTQIVVTISNGPRSYSLYWTGTSLQWRLMWGNILKGICNLKRFPRTSLHCKLRQVAKFVRHSRSKKKTAFLPTNTHHIYNSNLSHLPPPSPPFNVDCLSTQQFFLYS